MLLKKSRVVKRAVIGMTMMFCIAAKESEYWPAEVKQPKVGNFALPVSQQPGPLMSIGQNFLTQGELISWVYALQLKDQRGSYDQVVPSFLYGLTDELSLLVELPIVVKSKQDTCIVRDFSDIVVQLEKVVYDRETDGIVNDISILGNMSFPVGGSLSFGSPTFFFGTTLTRTYVDWYFFGSFGGQITTFSKYNKFGNLFLYQGGIGKNIAYKSDTWILNWLIEFNGIYVQHNIVRNLIDPNSGGNRILIGPSLFFSTHHLLFEFGVSAVAHQHLFGNQSKENYLAAAYLGWKF
jgi:hypothetical protein